MTSRFEPIPDARPDDVPWPQLAWPVEPDVVLRGDLVELRVVEVGRDGDCLCATLDDERVWTHVAERPASAEEYGEQLARALAMGRVPWVVRLRRPLGGLAAGTVVGTSSYLDVSRTDARLEVGSTAYAPAVWGTLVNPETKLLLLGHAFEVLGAGRVQLKTDVRNVRSQEAIARLGARYEGTLRRYQRRRDGSVRDTVMFSVTAEDWPLVRDRLRARLGGV